MSEEQSLTSFIKSLSPSQQQAISACGIAFGSYTLYSSRRQSVSKTMNALNKVQFWLSGAAAVCLSVLVFTSPYWRKELIQREQK